jgi:single-strand DNA-binding protein
MQDVICTITGNAVTDVRAATTAGGHLRATFRLAATPRRYDQAAGRFVDRDTTWVTVVCWRQLAENVAASLHRGDPVVVVGKLRMREWEEGGVKHTLVEIEAGAVGHDLTRGTSSFSRVRRLSPAESDERLPAPPGPGAAAVATGGPGEEAA